MIDDLLLTPIAAFVVYLALSALLSRLGRSMSHTGSDDPLRSSLYAGGERAPVDGALPGYSNTFVIALFFGVLHVGVLMLGSATESAAAVVYLVGLALVALILG
jgi:hypothetical protein